MYNQKNFVDKYEETKDFSKSILKYVITNNQINLNEEMICIYNEYDLKLRNVFKDLVKCEKSQDNKKCIDDYRRNFDELRSDISKKIEKLASK